MSLYGALFTGVSGLTAQGRKIGIISDNIANVNTTGYKQAKADFETLVVTPRGSATYAPGGVNVEARYDIDQQGLLSSTQVPTDIAVSGSGFFAVNAMADGSGQPLYTRAGSFRQDENGNMKNANGYYLRGWPLSRDGLKPGEPGNANTTPSANLDSLETINVSSSTGVAAATTLLEMGANLKASEVVYPGSGATIKMDKLSESNYGISSTDIIAPDEASSSNPSFGLSKPNGIKRGYKAGEPGDKFTITTGSGLSYDYEYGGFTIGRNVSTSGATNVGDGGNDLTATSLTAGQITVASGSNTVTVTVSGGHGLTTGDKIKISGMSWSGTANIPVSEINKEQVVTVTSSTVFTFTVSTTATSNHSNAATGTWTDRLFTGRILDANTTSQSFFTTSSLSDYTTSARSFTITTPTTGEVTFTYTAGSPQTSSGQFNNLTNLAAAINAKDGLLARVVGGRLMVGAEDASEEVIFANGDADGTSTLDGIDWIKELDLSNVVAGSRRFSTMDNLAKIINNDQGVSAVIVSPTGEANMTMRVDDPLDTIRITDTVTKIADLGADPIVIPSDITAGNAGVVRITVPGHGITDNQNVYGTVVLSGLAGFNGLTAAELNTTHVIKDIVDANTIEISITPSSNVTASTGGGGSSGTISSSNAGSLLAEFGIVDSLDGGAYEQQDTGSLGPEYDASGVNGKNMASGDITAQYSKTTRIYDALGTAHDIRFSFIKIDSNKWAVEIFSVDPDEISSSLVDGQIAVGTIEFNGDGSLKSVSSGLTGAIDINWTNGAEASSVTFDLGTAGLPAGTEGATAIGDTDGLTQFDSDTYRDIFVNQNGASVGELVSIAIDSDGYLIASYDNGESEKLYKIPVVDFNNPNGLTPISGNVYAQSGDSGDAEIRDAGSSGVGKILSSTIEQSNVDLASELTDMIVAQRAYQSNTRVISAADELLEQLNQI